MRKEFRFDQNKYIKGQGLNLEVEPPPPPRPSPGIEFMETVVNPDVGK